MLVTKMKEKNGFGATLLLKKKPMKLITNMSYMIPIQVLIIGEVALIQRIFKMTMTLISHLKMALKLQPKLLQHLLLQPLMLQALMLPALVLQALVLHQDSLLRRLRKVKIQRKRETGRKKVALILNQTLLIVSGLFAIKKKEKRLSSGLTTQKKR